MYSNRVYPNCVEYCCIIITQKNIRQCFYIWKHYRMFAKSQKESKLFGTNIQFTFNLKIDEK